MLHSYQYFLPKHLLTRFMGKIANAQTPWLKNFFIDRFIKMFHVDMSSAVIENPHAYSTFNSFFTRKLKPELRPIAREPNVIVAPADGTITQVGSIEQNQLLQAKQHYYDLTALLADVKLANYFFDGCYATFYLAPYNYHRVHMPLAGELKRAVYVPGKLFSVNPSSSEAISNLYTRNERLIALFHTEAGPLAVILVAAMIVGGIKMCWMDDPFRSDQSVELSIPKNFHLSAGDELGYFCMGSTVILLLPKDKCHWLPNIKANQTTQYGEAIGKVSLS